MVVLKDGRPEQVDCLWLPRGAYLRWTLRGMYSSNDRGWEQAAGEDAAPRDLQDMTCCSSSPLLENSSGTFISPSSL